MLVATVVVVHRSSADPVNMVSLALKQQYSGESLQLVESLLRLLQCSLCCMQGKTISSGRASFIGCDSYKVHSMLQCSNSHQDTYVYM